MNYIFKASKHINYKNNKKWVYQFNIKMHRLGNKKQQKFTKKIGFILKNKTNNKIFINKHNFLKWNCLKTIKLTSFLKKELF